MYPKKLKAWLSQFDQYYFTYSNGFYHLSFEGGSPRALIDSLGALPFVKHFSARQQLYSNNPFCEGGFYYQELEEGCWILYSKVYYKTNVAYDLRYKDAAGRVSDKESEYYMLSLNNVNNVRPVHKDFDRKPVRRPQYSWTFFKPGARTYDVNFKGSDSTYVTLYFNRRWLERNLMPNQLFTEAGLGRFIQSESGYIIWPLNASDPVLNNFALLDQVMHAGSEVKQTDLLRLKFTALDLIFEFFRLCRKDDVVNQLMRTDDKDPFSLQQVEDYLRGHLFERFPGISFLARRFGISETKLKTDFKRRFGKPLYQYFQDQQMAVARDLIVENQLLIKDVSFKFGYESPGKFSRAFKRCHGILPSELHHSYGYPGVENIYRSHEGKQQERL